MATPMQEAPRNETPSDVVDGVDQEQQTGEAPVQTIDQNAEVVGHVAVTDTVTPTEKPSRPTETEKTKPEIATTPGSSALKKGSRLLRWGAAATGVAVLGGGIGFVAGNRNTTEATPAPTTTPTTTGPSPEFQETKNNLSGNIQITRILEGEPTIRATRANGETIEVAALRSQLIPNGDPSAVSPENLNLFTESALGLVTCYLSTGSQQCLEEFSRNPEAQEVLQDIRKTSVEPLVTQNPQRESEVQVVMWDSPTDRASFGPGVETSGKKRNMVKLTGGTFYIHIDQATPDNKQGWQAPELHRTDMNNSFEATHIDLMLAVNNGTTVIDDVDIRTARITE